MSKPGLLNTGPMMDLINEGVAKDFEVYGLHEAADREALFAKAGADICALCTGSHTGVRTDAAMIARMPNLKIIGNFGVGYDTVDIAEAARRGIVITNTPEVLTEEVADTAHRPAARHPPRILRGREMAARGALAEARRLSPDRGFAARSHDRHHGHRPHRQSHRDAGSRRSVARLAIRAQPARSRRLSLL